VKLSELLTENSILLGFKAADRWQADARQLQQARDPQRKNERLRLIVADSVAKQIGETGQAQASLLVGQIFAQRTEGLAAYQSALERLAGLLSELRSDAGPIQTALDTAREEAIKALNESQSIYERLAAGTTPTVWIPQATLAAVYHRLARVDPVGAKTHFSLALDAIEKAVARRERSPYVSDALRYRDHLKAVTGPRPALPQPEQKEPQEESKAGDEDAGG
jgi:hypothetical protein